MRPVSFGGAPLLHRPTGAAEWSRLTAALDRVLHLGALPYERIRMDLIETVVEAKCHRLSGMDLRSVSAAERSSAQHLHVACLHDTMNSTISGSGAVDIARPVGARLPLIVSLANRGDALGEPRPADGGGRLLAADVPTIDGVGIRALHRAVQIAFDVDEQDGQRSVALNDPYLGAFEVESIARQLRTLEAEAVVRARGGELVNVRTGAYQAEFRREFLLGSANVDTVRAPGDWWPDPDADHIAALVDRLVDVYGLLRRRNFGELITR